jgi:serine/threonine protein kinase/tetratricopeptide (TPR) repeat protein
MSQGKLETPDPDVTRPLSGAGDENPTCPDSTRPLTPGPGVGLIPADRTLFTPGELVADRYLIVRFIARGGMGEVYEAYDRELNVQVALKTVCSEAADCADAVTRLRREIALARRVTHRHVCRIFDVGFHHRREATAAQPVTQSTARPTEHTTEKPLAFFTMELLTGETLADRLDRLGPLRPEDALPLCRQMAEALEAAHRAGVVHRDFKSDNVFLVPDDHEPGGLRVVVTDFGLALGRIPGAQGISRSLDGEFLGTPAYMAPEQIEGNPITPRTDLYALGVVLYEMVTGGRPFAESTPLATALKRLREPPPSPRELCPELPRAWEQTLLRCLERDPKSRFASAKDVVDALAGNTPTLRGPRWSVPRWRWLAALPLAALCGFGLHRIGWKSLPFVARMKHAAHAAHGARRSVAVLGFKNLSERPEANWLSTALAEMLSTELAAGEKLRLVPGENVARMKLDLELSEADSYGKDTLSRIRCHLNADLVVLGSYLALGKDAGGRLRLDLRLQDAATGELVSAINLSGTEAELLELVAQASGHLREKLGITRLSEREQQVVKAGLPTNLTAERLYSEGLGRLRRFDAVGAKEQLERAVAIEPDHPLLHAALSEALGQLGHVTQEQEEARRALELSAHLLREGKLLVEARYRTAIHDWDRATEIYRSLFEFFPDNLSYGLALMRNMTAAGHASEALGIVDQLRKLPPPARNDPRIDQAEASAAFKLPDFERMQQAAVRAATKAEANGQRLLAGRARMEEAMATFLRGDHARAMTTLRSAQRLQVMAGDQLGVAHTLVLFSLRLMNRGNTTQALRLAEEAAMLFRQIGNRRGETRALLLSGYLLAELGRPLAVRAKLGQAEAVARASGEPEMLFSVEADHAFEESFLFEGEVLRARQRLEQVLSALRTRGNSSDRGDNLATLGIIVFAQGDLETARKLWSEHLSQSEKSGEMWRASVTRMWLAELELAADRAKEAEQLGRQALREMEREGDVQTREASTRATLALTLATQGKTTEARREAEQALTLAEHSESVLFRLRTLLYVARVHLVLGQPADLQRAREMLTTLLTDAERSSLVGQALEARLALAQLEKKTGPAALARTALRTVAREADARGFGLIARQARQALR